METLTAKVRQKGVIALPSEVRQRYNLAEGDIFTLIDLGEGVLMLVSKASEVAWSGLRVGTPGDALTWVRERLTE